MVPVDAHKDILQGATRAAICLREGLKVVIGVADAGVCVRKLHIVAVLVHLQQYSRSM